MAKSGLLGCLEKRDMLNRAAVSIDRLVEWGQIFEDGKLLNDAVDFYIKAGSSEALEKLLPEVLDDGDAFLYGRIVKALGWQVSPEEWISLGQRAAALGKEAYAQEAFKKGGVAMEQDHRD